MGKAYVVDCNPLFKEEGSSTQEWDVVFGQTPDGAITVINEDVAESECKVLNFYNVKVGDHLCHLPGGCLRLRESSTDVIFVTSGGRSLDSYRSKISTFEEPKKACPHLSMAVLNEIDVQELSETKFRRT